MILLLLIMVHDVSITVNIFYSWLLIRQSVIVIILTLLFPKGGCGYVITFTSQLIANFSSVIMKGLFLRNVADYLY